MDKNNSEMFLKNIKLKPAQCSHNKDASMLLDGYPEESGLQPLGGVLHFSHLHFASHVCLVCTKRMNQI